MSVDDALPAGGSWEDRSSGCGAAFAASATSAKG